MDKIYIILCLILFGWFWNVCLKFFLKFMFNRKREGKERQTHPPLAQNFTLRSPLFFLKQLQNNHYERDLEQLCNKFVRLI